MQNRDDGGGDEAILMDGVELVTHMGQELMNRTRKHRLSGDTEAQQSFSKSIITGNGNLMQTLKN